jgi:O-antigen/teichoic acid export membrane protein
VTRESTSEESERSTGPSRVSEQAAADGLRVARNAGFLAAGSLGAMAFGFFGRVWLADRLGDQFGLVVGAQGFATLFLTIVQFGLHPLLVRQFASDPARAPQLLGTTLAVRAALGVAYALVVPMAAWSTGYMPDTRWLLMAFVVVELLGVLAETYSALCEGFERMGRAALIDMARPIASFLGIATAIYAGGSLEAFAVGYIAARLLQAGLAVALGRGARIAPDPRFVWAGVLPLFYEARWFATMSLVSAAQGSLAILMLTRFSTTAETALYGAALVFLEVVMIFPIQLQRALLPAFSRLSSTQGGATEMAHWSLRVVPMALFPAGAGLALLSRPIMDVYPSGGFADAAPALSVMGLWLFIMAPGNVAGSYLTGVGRIRALVLINCIGVGIQLIAQWWLVADHGALGASLATFATFSFVSLFSTWIVKDDGVRIPWIPWLRVLGATAVMSAILVPLRDQPLPMSVPVGALTFVVSLFLLLPRDSLEKRAFRFLIESRSGRRT